MKNSSLINRWRSDDESQYTIGRPTAKTQKSVNPSFARTDEEPALSTQINIIRRLFRNGAVSDCALDEQKHDPKNGQFTSGGSGTGKKSAKASMSNAELVASGNLRAMGGRKGGTAPKGDGPRRGKGGLIHLSEVKGGNFEEKLSNMDPADRKKWERHIAKAEKSEKKAAGATKQKHETVSEIAEKHKVAESSAKRKPKRNENAELVASGNLKAMGGRKTASPAKPSPKHESSEQSPGPDFATLASSLSGKKSMKKKDWAALASSYR
jgi:hypothetical protein